MNREEGFLNIISKTLSDSGFLGDDCAFLKDFNLSVSADTMVEDVHFRKNTITPKALGKKALLVNISDILASGAKPEYATISLSGKLENDFIKEFYTGVDEICREFNIKIIGGDLTGGEKISVSVTIFGNTTGRNISSRKYAKAGYNVFLAGEHGTSAIGLRLLENMDIPNDAIKEGFGEEYFKKAHLEPRLYPKISEIVSTAALLPYAMMDTSDGLFDALKKVSLASGVGFRINFDKILKQTNDFKTVMFGGEDFGLLICLSNEDTERVLEKLKGENITLIGNVTDEMKIFADGKEILEDFRYDHFE